MRGPADRLSAPVISGHGLQRAPDTAGRELVRIERLRPDGDAVSRPQRSNITRVADDARIDEVFVQMIDVLAHPVFQAAADGDVVEDRDVLDVLAESDTAGV